MNISQMPLGRLKPLDWDHVQEYHLMGLDVPPEPPASVEVILDILLPLESYNQGREGACVGFGSSRMMTIMNGGRYYDADWLWNQAKLVDGFHHHPNNNDGTTVRAAMDVLRDLGHVQIINGQDQPPSIEEGIIENRWATTVDQMRTCLAAKVPVAIGINWYYDFDLPLLRKNGDWWIGKDNNWDLGIRGGHCVCVTGASDLRQAFLICNSWGDIYPMAWLRYDKMQKLLDQNGEATVITDRPEVVAAMVSAGMKNISNAP